MSSTMVLERLVAALGDIHLPPDDTTCRLSGVEFTGRTRSELESRLARAVYKLLHSGEPMEESRAELRTPWLEEELISALPHRYSPVRARILETRDADVVVDIDGLRVLVGADLVVRERDGGSDPAKVWLRSARPALSPGFLLTDGSRGGLRDGRVLRFYVHVADPHEAGTLWGALTGFLEDVGARYRAKVLSCVPLYPRCDSVVVYLDSEEWDLLVPLTQRVSGMRGVGESTSLFARELAPGIAAACEPTAVRSHGRPMSFGQHRARAVASGVLGAKNGSLLESLAASLRSAGIDPERPYVDLGEFPSPDHWTHLLNTPSGGIK